MDVDRQKRAAELFDAALDHDEVERAAFLDESCAGDGTLRAEVESLLAADTTASGFLQSPALPAAVSTRVDDGRDRLVGQQIGRYKIRRLIATGGMGSVYEAVQDHPRRPVALKLMSLGLASPSVLRRFEYESQLLARLHHPGIAQVYEAGTHDDGTGAVLYFAMEYIPGAIPITEYAIEKGHTTKQRLELFLRVCDAVHHGHQKGIIHRDLKPSNILVDSAGGVKVIDFGVARSTDSDTAATQLQTSFGQLIGTLQYMSPEQCAGDPHDLDTRSDVYSLGVVLYELLCDQVPYDVSQVQMYEATRVIRQQPPRKPSGIRRMVRGDLETIILKSLEKDRDRRYQSAADLAQDIRRYLATQPIAARPPSMLYQLRTFARRNKVLVIGAAAVFVILAASTVVLSLFLVRTVRAENLASERLNEAQQARAVSETVTGFLVKVLSSVSPEDLGRPVLLKDILDAASSMVEVEFAQEPLVEARLRAAIGSSYWTLAEYSTAERNLQRALDVQRSTLGDLHRETLYTMETLAGLYVHQARYAEGQELYKQLLDRLQQSPIDEERSLARIMSRLAWSYNVQGRPSDAEPLLLRALNIKRRLLGDQDPETLITLTELGNVYRITGRYAEAEVMYQDALRGFRRVLTAEHRWTLYTLGGLAWLYSAQGRYAEAEPILQERLAVNQRVQGDEHQETLIATSELAALYLAQERFKAAEPLFVETLAVSRRVLGDDHRLTLDCLNGLAWTHHAQGRYESAMPLFAEAAGGARRTFPNESYFLGWHLYGHGECLAKLQRYPEAEQALLEACGNLHDNLGPQDSTYLGAVRSLVDLYEAWGKPDQATRWHGKLPIDADGNENE